MIGSGFWRHSGERRARRPDLLLPIGLCLLFFALSPGRLVSWDAGVRLAMTRALWSRGTVFFAPEPPAGIFIPPGAPGATSFYGIGQTLAFLPFDVIGALLAGLLHPRPAMREFVETLPVVFLYGPLVGLIWWSVIWRLLVRLGYSRAAALAGATIVMTSTIALVYVAHTLQEEASVGVLVTASLLAALAWGREGRLAHVFLGGVCGGLALLFRQSSVLALLPALGAALDAITRGQRRPRDLLRALPPALGGFGIGLALHALFAYWRFGSVWLTGYENLPVELRLAWEPVRPLLAAALLVGPGKGLLLLSPPLVLALGGLPPLWRRAPGLWSGVVLAFACSVVLHSKLGGHGYPDGSESWGPRFQVHLVGFLAAPMLGAIRTLFISRWGRGLVFAAVVAGLLIQLLAVMAPDSLEYCGASVEGDPRPTLLLQAGRGQLASRAVNVWRWGRGDAVETRGPCSEVVMRRMWSSYVPDLWGPVYAKRLSGRAMPVAVLSAWLFLGVGGAGLIALGLSSLAVGTTVPDPPVAPPPSFSPVGGR